MSLHPNAVNNLYTLKRDNAHKYPFDPVQRWLVQGQSIAGEKGPVVSAAALNVLSTSAV
jgi:hypothetical protein